MTIQASQLIAANIYREADRPEYRVGNRVLTAIVVLNIVIFGAVKVFYVWRNRQRRRIWDGMSDEEKKAYLEGLRGESGSGRLDFQFVS